jgi:hybrid cluster-associated redox disulfide protein
MLNANSQGWRENKMTQENPLAQKTIEDVLTTWPETAVVFKHHNMACIGCDVANFYTIADAAAVYKLPVDLFVSELESVIASTNH